MTLHVCLLSLTGGYECSKRTLACGAIFLQAGAYQKTLKLGKKITADIRKINTIHGLPIHMHEMKWGVVKKWKWGVFFFEKSGHFLNAGCVMYNISIFYFTFYLFGRGAYAPNAPPCLRACYSFAPAIRHPYYRHTAR